MDANNWLKERDRLRARVEAAEKKVTELSASVDEAKLASEAAGVVFDDGVANEAPDLEELRKAATVAKAGLASVVSQFEDAQALVRGTARALANHEAEAREVLEAGIGVLRGKVTAIRDQIEREWNTAAAALALAGARLAALDVAAGVEIVLRDPTGRVRTPEIFKAGVHGLTNTFEMLKVPKVGTHGLYPDDLVSKDRIWASAKSHSFPELASDHAALEAVGNILVSLQTRKVA